MSVVIVNNVHRRSDGEGHCVIMEIYIDEMIMNIMELENSSSHFHNKKGNLSSSLGQFFVFFCALSSFARKPADNMEIKMLIWKIDKEFCVYVDEKSIAYQQQWKQGTFTIFLIQNRFVTLLKTNIVERKLLKGFFWCELPTMMMKIYARMHGNMFFW